MHARDSYSSIYIKKLYLSYKMFDLHWPRDHFHIDTCIRHMTSVCTWKEQDNPHYPCMFHGQLLLFLKKMDKHQCKKKSARWIYFSICSTCAFFFQKQNKNISCNSPMFRCCRFPIKQYLFITCCQKRHVFFLVEPVWVWIVPFVFSISCTESCYIGDSL